ncbi:helicase-associated domain-containing protein [Antrihabitans sp. YC2-6]|uniref:helicase-associated domain-containing protein n=1 Tax=Antrihabitans sp. YC2-6 TaxID=2799498 RepID=UPI0018F358C7|nr:helicase-associated domain-containing protein [Antrihabitans sp. YC2-6]MBJ8344219.1 helicase-associated domain-containing protein [Antrihabitans sp. YC2-6]
MTATDRAEGDTGTQSLAAWLTALPDPALVELLRLRPDLTVPPPASLNVLANRAVQRASVLRAADDLDTLVLAVIESLALIDAHVSAVNPAALIGVIGDRAPVRVVEAALDTLKARALIWGNKRIQLVPTARDVVPWPIGRSLEPEEALAPDDIAAALAQLDPPQRSLLERLANTAPIGRTKDAAPGTPADRPVQRLLAMRLLTWIDEQTVELPHHVGQLLRGEPITDPSSMTAPVLQTRKGKPKEANDVGAGEALEVLRHCADVIEALGDLPAPTLRAGGMGVRELRRIAKRIGVDDERVSFLVELLAGAGLIVSGSPVPAPISDTVDDFWAPTAAADGWLEAPTARRWATLAEAWLDLPRRPWLIGMRDANDKPIAALSDEVRSAVAPRDRKLILSVLAELSRGESADAADLSRAIAWRRPRWAQRFTFGAVEATLAEASALGLVGRGALTSPGRALVHGGDAEAEMDAALPPPIDHVLLQADLTVVAPGPLTADLQSRISLIADLESAGAAAVYRISETSVRRALDAGMSASELHALFSGKSRTPVPQSLTYLVDDVARRHGQLRAGVASSFIRCEDPALLAQLLASPVAEDLALRGLAPTVAISQAPLSEVLSQLRSAGFAPAGEDSAGVIVDVRPHGARIATRRLRPQLRAPALPSDEQLDLLVRELRAGDHAASVNLTGGVRSDGSRASSAATVALLQLAVRVRRSVSIGYVDAAGTATNRVVEPVKVGGGQLDAFDPATGAVRHFTLHRISSVALVD